MNKIQISQDLVDDSNPVKWEEIEQELKGLPLITTGYIYTDAEQEMRKPSISYVFGGSFPKNEDDFKILGAFLRVFKREIPSVGEVYNRVNPEITLNSEGGKNFYARFIVAVTT